MKDYLDLEYITAEEAARLTKTNYATVLAAIKAGELTAIDGLGTGYRLTRAWVNTWVASKVVNPDKAGGDAA